MKRRSKGSKRNLVPGFTLTKSLVSLLALQRRPSSGLRISEIRRHAAVPTRPHVHVYSSAKNLALLKKGKQAAYSLDADYAAKSYETFKRRLFSRHQLQALFKGALSHRVILLRPWAHSQIPASGSAEGRLGREMLEGTLSREAAIVHFYRWQLQSLHTSLLFGRRFIERKTCALKLHDAFGSHLPREYWEVAMTGLTTGLTGLKTCPQVSMRARRLCSLGEACVVLRSPIHGYGLFAARHIPQGMLVIEYIGELINLQHANNREARLEEDGFRSTYMFSLTDEGDRIVDSTFTGNGARFANHSCLPNCEVDLIDGRLYLRALEDILPGEELCYNYHLKHIPGAGRLRCYCGAPNCYTFMDMG